MSLLAICCFSRFASLCFSSFFFFFNDTATTEIYTLSLHDALPIFVAQPLLVLGRALRIGVVQVGAELRQRAVGDVEPQLLLGLHQGEPRSEEHTSELQSRLHLVCRLLLEKKKKQNTKNINPH